MKRGTLILILSLFFTLTGSAKRVAGDSILFRTFQYGVHCQQHLSLTDTISHTYTRTRIDIDRKNPTLLLVPTMYAIAHSGERHYLDETYSRFIYHQDGTTETEELLRITTIPHRHHAMTSLLKYLTPQIYHETVIEDYLISPFHPNNKHYYKYDIHERHKGIAQINFDPITHNTQLVSGYALVEVKTGRIIKCYFSGEYDMVNFWLTIIMDHQEGRQMLPKKCLLKTRFRFIRSKVSSEYTAYYNIPPLFNDSLIQEDSYAQMCLIRPDTLNEESQHIYDKMMAQKQKDAQHQTQADHTSPHKSRWVKNILWDMIGNNIFNRIKTNFGVNNEGYVRVNPILNPLYMSYDHKRGFTYKFDVRTSYQTAPNAEFSARLKAGYAFKQHQLYFRLPMYYYLDKQRNNYIKLEIGNGNHIHDQSVRNDIANEQQQHHGANNPTYELLNEFKQNDLQLLINYNVNNRIGFQIGTLFERRVAVNKLAFQKFGREWEYRSFSPLVELQYRPIGWNGPIFSIDYNRSINGIFRSNTGYERVELNMEYVHHLNKLKSLQFHAGTGFYTWKNKGAYFLDYTNFSENNLPGGWNDSWSGDFDLLRSETYNNSEYYVRANLSYESPVLLLSWMPLVGRYFEMERLYLSVLDVHNIHPYVEVGYGFTTRLISCGVFFSNGKGNRTFGFKFGFEIFRHW